MLMCYTIWIITYKADQKKAPVLRRGHVLTKFLFLTLALSRSSYEDISQFYRSGTLQIVKTFEYKVRPDPEYHCYRIEIIFHIIMYDVTHTRNCARDISENKYK